MAETPAIRHAFDLLDSAGEFQLPPFVAVFGEDRFLRQQVLRHLEGTDPDNAFGRVASDVEWCDVVDELSTVCLFSSGPRHVVVLDADNFVTRCRDKLEAFIERPPAKATLLLDLRSFAANTKLYQKAARHGWIVECRVPQTMRGKSKQTDESRLKKWIVSRAKRQHDIRLSKDAQLLLIELIDGDFGRLDQELAKLALFVDVGGEVSAELVQDIVGGWRTKTTWEMLDAAADGEIASALLQLDQLIQSGESVQALFGSTAWSLRRFADATRLYELGLRQGRRPELPEVLAQANFRKWPPDQLKRSAMQLKRIGRRRCGELYAQLLDTDLSLKGSHSSPHRARLAIEFLLLRISQ